MVSRSLRVAVLGGDGRKLPKQIVGRRIRHYPSSRFGGNGAHRRLCASIRSGAVDLVVIIARWNGHSEVGVVRAACRRAGVKVRIIRS